MGRRPALRPAGEGSRRAAARARRRAGARRLPAARASRRPRPGGAAARAPRRGVLDAIDADPRAAFRSIGLSPRKLGEAVRRGTACARPQLHLLLAPHGLTWLVWRVHKHYGDAAHRIVRERPYELTSMFGVGFHTADRSRARPACRATVRSAPARRSCTRSSEAERDGSTCLPAPELARAVAGLLAGEPPTAGLLGEMAEHGDLAIEVDDEASCGATARRRGARGRAGQARGRAARGRARRSAPRSRATRGAGGLVPGARAGGRGPGARSRTGSRSSRAARARARRRRSG